MPRWTKIGTDVVVGGVAGSVSKLVEDYDADREVKAGKKLGVLAKVSTYVDYGIPILAIIGSVTGFLKGDWETRALAVGGTLAGRRITTQVKERTASWAPVEHGAPLSRAPAPSMPAGMGARRWQPTVIE